MVEPTFKKSIEFMFQRMLILSQLLVISQLITPTASFSPIIPPRFDNFCEEVVGAWGIPQKSQNLFIGEVEEVMRSCGGAVQGIREVPQEVHVDSSSTTRTSGMYHNRADDGFIYFDCGSNTQGPIQVTNDEDGPVSAVGCVTFGTMPKIRVFFDSSSGSWQTLVRGLQSQMSSEGNDKIQSTIQQDIDCLGMGVTWGKYIVCRMPSVTQPWMLQRAKWEQSTVDESNVISSKSKIEPNELEVKGWIKTWGKGDENIIASNENFRDYWGTTSTSLDDFLLNCTSQIIQYGAACMTTGEIKCILRCYDEKGALKGVILQQGKLDKEEGVSQ
jgi:hypothetical protein